jgi:hypothetical protein
MMRMRFGNLQKIGVTMSHPLNLNSQISRSQSNAFSNSSTKYPMPAVPKGLSGESTLSSAGLTDDVSKMIGKKRKEVEVEPNGSSIKRAATANTAVSKPLSEETQQLLKETSRKDSTFASSNRLVESKERSSKEALTESEAVPKLSSEEIQRLLIEACRADPSKHTLPRQLTAAVKILYEPAGIEMTKEPSREARSEDYGACHFSLNGRNVVFRVAKTTPTKIGQFVTVWKRPGSANQPFESRDKIDFVVVSVLNGHQLGQFIFDKDGMIRNKIFSHAGQKGKMAFRIYSPSDKPTAKDAIATKAWQSRYFFSLAPSMLTDSSKTNVLFERVLRLFKPLS